MEEIKQGGPKAEIFILDSELSFGITSPSKNLGALKSHHPSISSP